MTDNKPLKAIAYTNLAMITLALSNVMFKTEVEHLSAATILFARAMVMTIITGAFLILTRRIALFATQQPGLLILRAVMSLITSGLFIYSLKYLEVAVATTISMLSPLLIALVSWRLLRERVDSNRWLAIIGGFASVAYILRPGGGLFNTVTLIALLSAVCYAFTMILNRKLVRHDDTLTIIFYISLASSLILAPFEISHSFSLPANDYIMLAGIGVLSVLGQFFAIGAYRYASAHTVAVFDYSSIIYVAIAGFIFLNEKPGTDLYLGATGLIIFGIWIIAQETKEKTAEG